MTSRRASASCFSVGGPLDGDPRDFHLRQACNLRQAAQGESQRFIVRGKRQRRLHGERVVQEDFVGNDRHIALSADVVKQFQLARFEVRTCGIVGMNSENRSTARIGCLCAIDRFEERHDLDLPTVIVNQFIRKQLHVLNLGEEVEERITRSWNQHRVSGIAEQAKQERIRFAGAGREDEIRRARSSSRVPRSKLRSLRAPQASLSAADRNARPRDSSACAASRLSDNANQRL